MIRTALPIFVIGAMAVVAWWLKTRWKSRASTAGKTPKAIVVSNFLFSACFFLIFLVYPGCTFISFSTFICSTLDDGSRYLRRDASIDCNDPFHTTMQAYAAVMICIWPFGVPLLYSFGFWRVQKQRTRTFPADACPPCPPSRSIRGRPTGGLSP